MSSRATAVEAYAAFGVSLHEGEDPGVEACLQEVADEKAIPEEAVVNAVPPVC